MEFRSHDQDPKPHERGIRLFENYTTDNIDTMIGTIHHPSLGTITAEADYESLRDVVNGDFMLDGYALFYKLDARGLELIDLHKNKKKKKEFLKDNYRVISLAVGSSFPIPDINCDIYIPWLDRRVTRYFRDYEEGYSEESPNRLWEGTWRPKDDTHAAERALVIEDDPELIKQLEFFFYK